MNDLKSLIILFKTYHSVERNVKQSLIGTGVNVSEFAAMEALYVKGEMTTQCLINSVLIPNSSMTYVLEILNQKKYITRVKKASDKRIQMLSLSDMGKAFFESIYGNHFSHMRALFDVLNEEEELQLQVLLKKLGKKAEGALR